jgi:hypothetical protein
MIVPSQLALKTHTNLGCATSLATNACCDGTIIYNDLYETRGSIFLAKIWQTSRMILCSHHHPVSFYVSFLKFLLDSLVRISH